VVRIKRCKTYYVKSAVADDLIRNTEWEGGLWIGELFLWSRLR